MVSYIQPIKFGKSIFNRFWGVLWQSVHPESNISHFPQCFLWGSAVWFFVKACLRVRKSNFKIIFLTSLGSLPVSRPNLINLYLTNFGACSANQCTQNEIKDFIAVFLCLIVLLGFFIKARIRVRSVTSK